MSAVLREELQRLRVMELHARAKAAGVDAGLLEDAMDSVQPKEPLIALLVARQGRDTTQQRAPEPQPEPEGSGGGIYGTPAGAPGTSASASGAGQLVLPDGGSSKQMPEQS